jgi:hypothetical protein
MTFTQALILTDVLCVLKEIMVGAKRALSARYLKGWKTRYFLLLECGEIHKLAFLRIPREKTTVVITTEKLKILWDLYLSVSYAVGRTVTTFKTRHAVAAKPGRGFQSKRDC